MTPTVRNGQAHVDAGQEIKQRLIPVLVARSQHAHPIPAGTLANVGSKGPRENIDSSAALDLTFAYEYSVSG